MNECNGVRCWCIYALLMCVCVMWQFVRLRRCDRASKVTSASCRKPKRLRVLTAGRVLSGAWTMMCGALCSLRSQTHALIPTQASLWSNPHLPMSALMHLCLVSLEVEAPGGVVQETQETKCLATGECGESKCGRMGKGGWGGVEESWAAMGKRICISR